MLISATRALGRRLSGVCLALAALVLFVPLAQAIQNPHPHDHGTRFDDKIRHDPARTLSTRTVPVADLPSLDPRHQAWNAFEAEHQGARWSVRLDSRSGLPSLAVGTIAWVPGPANDLPDDGKPVTTERLVALAKTLIERHPVMLGDWRGQLVLDEDASFVRPGRFSQIVLRQAVGGIPVEESAFIFHVSGGNLVSFGTASIAPASIDTSSTLSSEEARRHLVDYLAAEQGVELVDLESPALVILPVDPAGQSTASWVEPVGTGIAHRLAWKFEMFVPGEDPRWVGKVDAHTGEVLAFYDQTMYDAAKGGVFPISPDGDCANEGCEEPGYPMPFVDISEDGGGDAYTGDFGIFACSSGSEVSTNLSGQYFYINDVCGPVDEGALCEDGLDLGMSAGLNCAVAEGASPGNTEASRSMYFSINRVGQKARWYLPDNSWLNGRVQARSNVNGTCNAFWNGSVNMYRAGSGCANTSTINGVVTHEWGHGMDQNDGGGYDNPSEAYADVVAIFETRESCVGRGFFSDGRTCSGYGDTCLTCTGIRDMDYTAREAGTPATPTNFNEARCGGGGGVCGKEVHCESYVPSEAVYDLATRDLPAAGLDAATAWQLAERLFYETREGSTGDVYNCSLPDSDSCGSGTWYHRMRVADDDDGNLANGTPHAAAIFAAFDRHDIACGSASDPENQSTSSCPSLAAPVVTAKPLTNSVELTWDPVPEAGSYVVHRADIGCERSFVPIAELDASATTYIDDELINDFTVHYRVQAFGTNAACSGPLSGCVETAPQPFAGKVRFDQETYGCSNLVTLNVTDANVGAGSVDVEVWSDSEPTPELVVLTETVPGSGKFTGTIETTSGAAQNGDGLLAIENGDLMTAEYVDADDGIGGTNQVRQDTATGDCVFPQISNVHEENVTGSAASIRWATDEISDTVLVWGETIPPDTTETGASRTTDHRVDLSGLQECTVYYYEARSTDPAGNTAVDDRNGAYHYFETLGDFGEGLQPCHAGQVDVNGATYSCSDTVTFSVTDIDLNPNPETVDTATLLVTSSTETEPEAVLVTETGANTSRFTGSIGTASGPAVAGDGVLQTAHGDLITVTYRDADDGTGAAATNFDVATADCSGSGISNLRVDTITDQRATIRWDSDEPTDTVVEWGPTPALGETTSSSTLTTGHAVTLNQFTDCQEAFFRIRGTDAYGNTTVIDNHGEPLRFALGEIPGLYYRATFEDGAPDWTLEGEWEAGSPQGLGGDPGAAYNNQAVLGEDLTGQGGNAGGYEPSTDESAFTPVLDASTWTNTELIFYRRLRVDDTDEASLWVFAGPGYPLYRNDGSTVNESSFSLQRQDVSGVVDGRPQAQFEFRMNSDAATEAGGWTLDDFILKDATTPDYGACVDCGVAPSFTGATSAIDNDACGATGTTVSWDRAVSWGSGSGGTYNVYRGTTPDFPADASHRIATGLDALSYDDSAAPSDTTLYYLVEAESSESCGTGPANGGVVDGNAIRVSVSETTSRPTPDPVAGVRIALVGYAHVRLSWDAAAGATEYVVYRSPQPDEGFTSQGQTAETAWEDQSEGGTSDSYFYLVRGMNPCGTEGP